MIDTLCLSGGGLKGLSFVGALKILEEKKIIKINKIKNYYANSAGAILSLLLAIGYDLISLEKFINKFDFNKLVPKFNFNNVINNLGISDGSEFMIVIETLLKKKTKLKDLTFKEFYEKFKINLVFITSNYTKGCEETLSYYTTPNLSVLLGVRMSISVPLLFSPVIYNNNIYVDGLLFNNFPIDKIEIDKSNYIAIRINSNYKRDNPNVVDFLVGCLNLLSSNACNFNIKNNKIIDIYFNDIQELDLDNKNINLINNIGKKSALEYINKNEFINNLIKFNYVETFTKKIIDKAIDTLNK